MLLYAGAGALDAVALLAGAPHMPLAWLAVAIGTALTLTLLVDAWLSARAIDAAAFTLKRRLPQALAVGVATRISLHVASSGQRRWRLELFDHALEPLVIAGQPVAFTLEPGASAQFDYEVTPAARGAAVWQPAELRIRTRLGLGWLRRRIGNTEQRRVLPDFAQIRRFAWLADQHRLGQIGVRTRQRRGEGTEFRQLTEYRPGDAVRHIDWKATLRSPRPVVREFQDERDQSVLVLLDCGRRMRSAEREERGAHFDQVLNAVVLLAYVALRHGDAVGAMTFGLEAGGDRHLAPTKGNGALNRLVAGLHDVQPTLQQPDLLGAAVALMSRQRRRALIVVVTNFRTEDDDEVRAALRLLHSRHLVMFASVREHALAEAIEQPLSNDAAVLEMAAAHRYMQARRSALARIEGTDALLVDAEPARLGVDLVNCYRAAKQAGLL